MKGWYRKVLLVFSKQTWTIGIMVVLMMLISVGNKWGETIQLSRPAIDWFDPKLTNAYRWHNITGIRITEGTLSIIALWFMSGFPSNLKIYQEVSVIIGLNFFWNWVFEVSRKIGGHGEEEYTVVNCYILYYRSDFAADLLRSIVFPLVLCYYCHYYKESVEVPPARISYLHDFCYDMECVKYFNKYLHKKYPNVVDDLNEYIQQAEGADVEHSKPGQSNRSKGLNDAFERYKKTKSFSTLKRSKEEAEIIRSLGFTTSL